MEEILKYLEYIERIDKKLSELGYPRELKVVIIKAILETK